MAGFLYYVPESLTIGEFRRSHLTRFGEVLSLATRGVEAGPDGKSGTILVIEREHKPRPGYFAERQEWQQAPGAAWWVGWERESRPIPVDLQRDEVVAGHEIKLEDGNLWTIPLVRLAMGGSALDQRLRLRADGGLIEQPLQRYAAITRLAEQIWQLVRGQADQEEPAIEVEWDHAIQALAMNYYLAAEEVSVLGLLTKKRIGDILLALIDWPTFTKLLKEMNKKKVPVSGESSTGSGETDSPPATRPHSPTSSSGSEDTKRKEEG